MKLQRRGMWSGLGPLVLALASLAVGLHGCGSDDTEATPGSGGAGGSGAGAGASAGAGGSSGSAGAVSNVEAFADLGGATDGLAFAKDGSGNVVLYVSQPDADAVMKVTPTKSTGKWIDVNDPRGLALRANGELLVCGRNAVDEGVLWRVGSDGNKLAFVQGAQGDPYLSLESVAVAPDDRVVFSDHGTNRIYRVDADGSNLSIISSTIPEPDGLAFSEDGGILYVAAGNGEIHKILRSSATGAFDTKSEVLVGGVATPNSISVMKNGDLLVVGPSSGVTRITADGQKTSLANAAEFMQVRSGAAGVDAFGEMLLYVAHGSAVSRLPLADSAITLPVR